MPLQKNISFALEDVEEIPDWADVYPENKFTVMVIDAADYGMMDAEKVLKKAIVQMKKFKNK